MAARNYFLGANSPEGFYGYFQKAYGDGWTVWRIKGGPGCGKSTLMKQVAQNVDGVWEYIHCSSDPKSLDAIICEQRRVMIADATAPHSMEALRPGCVERLLDLGDGFCVRKLQKNAAAIDALYRENAALHRQAVHYLAAAAQVQRVRMERALAVLDEEAVQRLADQHSAAWSGYQKKKGVERQRGLGAVTPDGIVFYKETVRSQTEKLHALNDDWGAAAAVFMAKFYRNLQMKKCDMTVCCCSLFPKERIEHILLPEARVAYVTENFAHAMATPAEIVDLRDMYGAHRPGTNEALRRLLTQEKQLLETASGYMYQARLVHDALEEYYIQAMDFSFVQEKTEQLIRKIGTEMTE